MLKTMAAPGRYIQGYNVTDDFSVHASRLGNRPFIIGGRTALSRVKEKIMYGADRLKKPLLRVDENGNFSKKG